VDAEPNPPGADLGDQPRTRFDLPFFGATWWTVAREVTDRFDLQHVFERNVSYAGCPW